MLGLQFIWLEGCVLEFIRFLKLTVNCERSYAYFNTILPTQLNLLFQSIHKYKINTSVSFVPDCDMYHSALSDIPP